MRYADTPFRNSEDAVLDYVVEHIADCHSFLDVGSGDGKYTNRFLGRRHDITAWAVDAWAAGLAQTAATRKFCGELPQILDRIPDDSVDAVFCLDVIEHLQKDASKVLIRSLERVARKIVVLFTPRGFMPQGSEHVEASWQPWMAHLCGWDENEFEALGYEAVVWRDFDYGKAVHDALWGVKTL